MGRMICEGCISIDVRDLARRGFLKRVGLIFPLSWTRAGEPYDHASVHVETDSVVLFFRFQSTGKIGWIDAQQRIPIVWTTCHFGGRRPWFVCTSHSDAGYCGQSAAILYRAGDAFACRRCYGLNYLSQHESPRLRSISRSRKIRMRLGGSENLLEPFPQKPRGMHRRTFSRLRAIGEVADRAAFRVPLRFRNMALHHARKR